MLNFTAKEKLNNYCVAKLFVLYKKTSNIIYLNELYDRCYHTLKEEQAPTRQKIYKRKFEKK